MQAMIERWHPLPFPSLGVIHHHLECLAQYQELTRNFLVDLGEIFPKSVLVSYKQIASVLLLAIVGANIDINELIEIDASRVCLFPNLAVCRYSTPFAFQGVWKGYRSSRLSKQYRVIYQVKKEIVSILVIDANAHDYKRN